MFLNQPYHECDDPEWESSGVVIFEDGRAEFKYDCTAREVSSNYSHTHNQLVEQMGQPCGATERVYLEATDETSDESLEAIEQVGDDLDEQVTIVRADPPTPDDPEGLFVVEVRDYQVVYN
jgi:hypothetical protein